LHYEARLRGLELCAINLTSTLNSQFPRHAFIPPHA
jgi:hypothetical protein